MLGVRKSSIQKYENSSIVNLKLKTIRKLCKTFQVPPYVFVFPEMWDVSKMHSELRDDFVTLVTMYITLSESGREKVRDYVKDMKEIPQYNNMEVLEIDEIMNFINAGLPPKK